MGSFSAAVRNAWLDAAARGVPYSNAQIWVQLHIGDPGSDGTGNPAANTTRKLVAFAAPSASGSIASTGAATWLTVPASETYTQVSLWSASTAGVYLGEDSLAAPVPVLVGDPCSLQPGDLILAVGP